MTLEEAIKHAEEVAEENQERANSNILIERNGTKFLYDGEEYKKCCKCAEEHRQLAEWLTDYQRLLKAIDDIRAEIDTMADLCAKTYDNKLFGGLEFALGIIDMHIGKESE